MYAGHAHDRNWRQQIDLAVSGLLDDTLVIWGGEFGCYPVGNPVGIRDLQATVPHLLDLDPYRFHYTCQGLDNRRIGPTSEVKALLA